MQKLDVRRGLHLFMDGNAWCAVGPHFVDLQVSPAGFGATQQKAVANLRAEWKKDTWWGNHRLPELADFTVHHPETQP